MIVKVMFVPAFAIESKIIFIEVDDIIKHREVIDDVNKEHVESAVLIEVYIGNVITINELDISLFIVINHKL